MRIGQLAQAIDLPTSTIRFYEQKGLLPPAARTAKGYRQYDTHAIERLKMIKFATSLGFSLDDLPGLFASGEGLDHQQVMVHLRERKQDIDDLMAKLERQKSQMVYLIHRLEELWKTGHCMTACELDGLLEGLNMDNVREV